MHALIACSLLAGCAIHDSVDAGVFGHDFAITVGHADVAAREPNGTLWDTDGSAPDPYAQLYVDGNVILTTQDVSNSFTADWTDQVTRRIDRGASIELWVWDSDPLGMGDLIAKCGQGTSIQADELRAGELTCSIDGSIVSVFFAELN
ncbi:MAG: hypothetical protein JWO36_3512 [Myxococcales bacterium]|nr:hypothetical protein [Myxococcales bacterium]